MNHYEEALRTYVTGLENMIVKSKNLSYRKRPTCAQLIDSFNEWGFDVNQLGNTDNFIQTQLINGIPQTFTVKYLLAKLN